MAKRSTVSKDSTVAGDEVFNQISATWFINISSTISSRQSFSKLDELCC